MTGKTRIPSINSTSSVNWSIWPARSKGPSSTSSTFPGNAREKPEATEGFTESLPMFGCRTCSSRIVAVEICSHVSWCRCEKWCSHCLPILCDLNLADGRAQEMLMRVTNGRLVPQTLLSYVTSFFFSHTSCPLFFFFTVHFLTRQAPFE